MSGALKSLIRREVNRQKESKIGTVLSNVHLTDFDAQGSGVWVVDVEIGSNHYLRNVPVKAIHSRFFAQLGQVVSLRRNAQGRWEVTGPGDRLSVAKGVKTYDLTTRAQQSASVQGWISDRKPFEYYQTLSGGAPLGVLWADTVTPFNLVAIVAAT